MAKFRQGNLILNNTEKVIQGGSTVIDSSRSGRFSSLRVASGTTISNFSTNTSLGTSDNAVSTQNAVKTYVDSKISGSIATSSDNRITRYDGTDNLQGTGITIDDSDNITGISTLTVGSGNDAVYLTNLGAIEIIDSGGNAYIDFKNSSSEDRDCQIAQYLNGLQFMTGGAVVSTAMRMDSSQNIEIPNGNLSISGTTKSDGALYAGTTAPDSTTRLNYDGYFYATKTFNGVWNDYADFQEVDSEQIAGRCYYDTLEGARLCTQYCQKAVIGIISDTFGHAVGVRGERFAPFAISGWVLAYIEDDDLEPGDALTSSPNGKLTKMFRKDVERYPDRIVATYKKPEKERFWGPEGSRVRVDGRHWVKVR